MLLPLKAMPFHGFSIFKVRSTFWSLSWDLLLCQPFLSQPLWLTLGVFFFFFHPTAPVLGCQTPQSVTLLPSLQRNNSHCDKGFHDVALGDPHMCRQVGQAFISVGDRVRVSSSSRINGSMMETTFSFPCIYMRCVSICNSSIATSIYSAQRTLAQCVEMSCKT